MKYQYLLFGGLALSLSSHTLASESDLFVNTDQSEPEAAAATPVSSKNGFYAGIHAGAYQSDISWITTGAPAGVVLGYGNPQFGVEFDLLVSDMEIQGEPVSYSTAGFYLSYRSATPVYGKFRIGMVEQAISVSSGSSTVIFESDFGMSTSVGVGKRFANSLLLDLEYTVIDQDLSAITLGLNKHF